MQKQDIKQNTYLVPAVVRVLKMIEYLAKSNGASFGNLLQGLGFPRSSIYHLLITLQETGYVRENKGRYILSSKIHELSNVILSNLDIRTEAMPTMRRLMREVNLSCQLAMILADEAIYVAKVDSHQSLLSTSWMGKRLSLMNTSLGKVLLAWSSEEEIHSLLQANSSTLGTEKSIIEVENFIASLESVRNLGWAYDDEESIKGLRCVGVPIRNMQNQVVAALSLTGEVDLVSEKNIPELVHKATEAAKEITGKLAI